MILGIFRRSRAANSAVPGLFLRNFALFQDFMAVLIAYKNEKDPIKNEGTRVVTALYIFLDAQGQLTP